MNFLQLYTTTLISAMPDIINTNFNIVQQGLNVFYDETNGVIISPINTPGRVKGANGEFVNMVVDNLTVRNQYTNLYQNITTANYDYWSAFTGVAAPLRPADPSVWENIAFKYIDVNKPYYKIEPDVPIALNTNNKSQIVQLLLDASGIVSGSHTYNILLNPSTGATNAILSINVDISALLLNQETRWVSLICVDYDAFYGPTWEVYEFGEGAAGSGGSGGGGGGGVSLTTVNNLIAAAIVPYTGDLRGVNASLLLYTSNVSANLAFGQYATNASVNNAFLTNSSLGQLSINSATYNTSIGALTLRHNVTETSLGALTLRVNVVDSSISWLNTNKQPLGDYIMSASIGTSFYWHGGKLDVCSNSAYATQAYVDGSLVSDQLQIDSLSSRVTNLEASTGYVTYSYVNSSLNARDASITSLFSSKLFTEASLYTLLTRHNITETSLYTLTSRYNLTETSLGTLTTRHNLTEASLYALTTRHNFTETSLGSLTVLTNALNASMGSGAFTTKTYVDGSLSTRDGNISTLNSQVSILTSRYNLTETSVGIIVGAYVPSASLGAQFVWSGGTLTVNVSSGSGYSTFAYVNASLAFRDTSINALYTRFNFTDASLYTLLTRHNFTETSLYTSFLTNASLGLANNIVTNTSLGTLSVRANNNDTSIAWLNSNKQGLGDYIKSASLNSTQFFWGKSSPGIVDISVAGTGGYVTQSYVDASLLTRDGSIVYLFTNKFITDLSLNTLTSRYNPTEASLATLTTNYNFSYSLLNNLILIYNITESSLGILTSRYNPTEASLATLTSRHNLTEASLNTLTSRHNFTETSLYTLTTRHNLTESSLYTLTTTALGFATNASISLAYFTNASLGTVSQLTMAENTSIGNLTVLTTALNTSVGWLDASVKALQTRHNITEVSLGNIYPIVTALNASMGPGLVTYATNTSVGLAFYSNASLGLTNNLVTNVSLGNVSQLAYALNASEAWLDASVKALQTRHNITETSLGNVTVLVSALNTSMGSGLITYATNTSVGLALFSNASLGLSSSSYATNASVGLALFSNASLGNLSANLIIDNASIGTLTSRHNFTEASLYTLTTRHNFTEASLYALTLNDLIDDASLSLLTARHNVTETSLGLVFSTSKLSGLQDVSIVNASDNNYLRYNASIGKWVNEPTIDASTFFYSKSQVDSSFALIVNVNASLNNASPIASYTDTSSYNKATYIADSSLNQTKFKWIAGVLEPSVAGTGTGSTTLSALTDVSITGVAADNLLKYDGSFGKWMNIAPVNASTYFYTKAQIDTSIFNNSFLLSSYVNTSTYYDASLVAIINSFYSNASLGLAGGAGGLTRVQIDASYATNASVGLAFYSNPSLGLAFNQYTNASMGLIMSRVRIDASYALIVSVDINKAYVDASLGYFLKSSSVGTSLYWHAGVFDVSLNAAYATQEYVDGSFNNEQGQINSLSGRVTTLEGATGSVTFNYVNASLNARDASIVAVFNRARITETSLGVLTTKYNATETSLGTLTSRYNITETSLYIVKNLTYALNASLSLYATNASVSATYATYSYVNSSLGTRDGNISTLNSQMNTVTNKQIVTDTSLYNNFLTNPSLGLAGVVITSIAALSDVSITGVSTNDMLKYDGSFGKWMNSTPINASAYFYTKAQIDASIFNNSFLLSSYVNTSTYYDGSLNNIRTLLAPTKAFQTLTIANSSMNWNVANGYNATVTLTMNVSLYMVGSNSGDSGTLIVIQDASGSRLINLPTSSLKNSSWSLSTTGNARDIISFVYDGSSYYWNKGGSYS